MENRKKALSLICAGVLLMFAGCTIKPNTVPSKDLMTKPEETRSTTSGNNRSLAPNRSSSSEAGILDTYLAGSPFTYENIGGYIESGKEKSREGKSPHAYSEWYRIPNMTANVAYYSPWYFAQLLGYEMDRQYMRTTPETINEAINILKGKGFEVGLNEMFLVVYLSTPEYIPPDELEVRLKLVQHKGNAVNQQGTVVAEHEVWEYKVLKTSTSGEGENLTYNLYFAAKFHWMDLISPPSEEIHFAFRHKSNGIVVYTTMEQLIERNYPESHLNDYLELLYKERNETKKQEVEAARREAENAPKSASPAPPETSGDNQWNVPVAQEEPVKEDETLSSSYGVAEYTLLTEPYILKESSTRKISESELENLELFQLNLARNEIMARHGYSFKNIQLGLRFGYLDWYVENPAYDGTLTSEIEKYNIALIQRVEMERKAESAVVIKDAEEAWKLITFEIKAYNKPDLKSYPADEVYGERFYFFTYDHFNNEGLTGDLDYAVSEVTGNIYERDVMGNFYLRYRK